MPIVPHYDLPEGVPLAPRYATAPIDNTVPAMMERIAQTSLVASRDLGYLAAHKARVADTTEMAKRAMMIDTDLDSLQNDIRSNRDLHKEAASHYDEAVKGMSERWVKGLRPDLQEIVNANAVVRLIPRRRA